MVLRFYTLLVRTAGMDLGEDYLAALTSKDGCLLVRGKALKARNRRCARRIAKLTSLQKGETKETKQIQLIRKKRDNYIKDHMHKASKQIVEWLDKNGIDTLVIGRNKGWKKNPKMPTAFNKSFQPIPFEQFVHMVRYKAEARGIQVLETEESYTSKASFTDRDEMKKLPRFSGRRISRSLYKDGKGRIIHADLNGAGNIARKMFPAFEVEFSRFSCIQTLKP